MPNNKDFINLLSSHKAKVAVIGLGYVGLPLAVEFASGGFVVTGIDILKSRVDNINQGLSDVQDVPSEILAPLVESGNLSATRDYAILKAQDVIIICVPTPLSKTKDPDVSYIMSAVKNISQYLHKLQLIVLESTTYPGTTRELILPKLEETGLKSGEDFFLAFSPERIDPGNKEFGVKNTPKIVGGITSECTEIVQVLYEQIIEKVIPVSSSDSAEMVKLLENTFRSVNIGLVNEIAQMCHVLKVDVWEIIEAASTKPFGFMPFFPGPGLGGHCIPIDPLYLSWKLRSLDYYPRFIDLASEINSHMPKFVVNYVMEIMNSQGKCLKGNKILVLGIAYKKDIDDVRESPALDIMELLLEKGAEVSYYDPYVPEVLIDNIVYKSIELTDSLLEELDCVLITTNHSSFDYLHIAEHTSLIIDTRNATKGLKNTKALIAKL